VIAGVADTHAALWYLSKHPRLSLAARNFIDGAAEAGNEVVISPISLAEILYLIEKNRMPRSAYEDVKAALADPASVLQEGPFNINVVDAMRQVPRDDIPDMPDRIVAATAIFLGVPVISRDGRIRASAIRTIW
jgi:PIN domain nuclease of toxin-antitoxin system